jgi:plastocyanin
MDPVPRRRLGVAATATLALALGACGSDDPSPTTDGASPPAAADGTIVAVDFTLSDLEITPGSELRVENRDSTTHTATADDGSFDIGGVQGGTTSDPVAGPSEPGKYTFHCEIHPSMTGTLTVEG